MRPMELMPQAARDALPALGATEGRANQATVHLKLFDPGGRLTLYVLEYDGDDLMFGYMKSPLGPDRDEFGYTSLAELRSIRNRLGLPLERDAHWTPVPLAEALGDPAETT